MISRMSADPIKPAPPVTNTRMNSPPTPALSVAIKDKRAFEGRKPWQLAVLLRQNRLLAGYRPFDADFRIVPDQSCIMGRRIMLINLVKDARIGLKRTKPMRKPGRDQQLVALLSGEA